MNGRENIKRKDLEHIIRAAAGVTDEYEFVIIGSQAILGTYPDAPDLLLESMEADIYPLLNPDMADLIDGAIGELSPFDERFGYYAQGVGPETAVLPEGWQNRLVKIQNENTLSRIAYCLEPNDLAISKLAAGRDKDWVFVEALIEHRMVDPELIQQRLSSTSMTESQQLQLTRWVAGIAAKYRG